AAVIQKHGSSRKFLAEYSRSVPDLFQGTDPRRPKSRSGNQPGTSCLIASLTHGMFPRFPEPFVEFFYLLTERNRPLEVEVVCRIMHLLFQLDNHVGDLRSGEMFCVLDLDFLLFYRFYDRLRDDMMLLVVRDLPIAPALCLGDCDFHRIGHGVSVEHNFGVHVSCRPPDDLDQAACIAEEPFLICVEDADEPHLGDVEALPKQVDPDQYIECTQPQFTDNLGALQGLDLRVEVPGADPPVGEVF